MPLMLSVACRAPSGTTGIAVVRAASAGSSSRSHAIEHHAHVLDRADAEERHAAVRDAAARHHLEPVHAAMADADAIDVQRLGDDDVVGPRRALMRPCSREPGDAGKAAALLVDGAADLDGAVQLDAGAADRLGRVDRGGDAGLHVARCRGRRCGRRARTPPNGSTVHPAPAGTTSKWPFRCTSGPRAIARARRRRR